MKTESKIIIASTTVIVLGILYFAYKKTNDKSLENNPDLQKDYDNVMAQIKNAKK